MTRRHATPSTSREPCANCGEETGVGSVFFSDRRSVHQADGAVTYLCSLCDAQIAAGHHQERLTEEQIRGMAENWAAAWLGRTER